MRYPDGYKEEMRQQLLALAGAKAKSDGFGATGVDSLASAAGVTSGAVYSHFGSKSNLFVELVRSELARSQELLTSTTSEDILKRLDSYLSLAHVHAPEAGCGIPALSSEVARAAPEARQAYEQTILKMQRDNRELVGGDRSAWMLLSLAIGAIVIARAMHDDSTRQELLDAVLAGCREILGAPTAGPIATKHDPENASV